MKKLFSFKNICIAVPTLVLLGALHYFLPQVDVVRVVGTDIKRVDSVKTETGNTVTRDTYFIQTQTLDGRPSVYRNEDVLGFLKIDAADLQAEMQAFAVDNALVAIRHYGWRIRLLSMFPNAMSAWSVEEDYSHTPVFNIIFLTLLAAGFGWFGWKLRRIRAQRLAAKEQAKAQALAAQQAQEASRAAQLKKSRADVDSFLESDN